MPKSEAEARRKALPMCQIEFQSIIKKVRSYSRQALLKPANLPMVVRL